MHCSILSILITFTLVPSLLAGHSPSKTLHKKASSILPFDIGNPGATPLFNPPPTPSLLPVGDVIQYIHAVTAPPTSVLGNAAVAAVKSLQSGGKSSSLLSIVTSLLPNLGCSLFGCASVPAASVISAIVGPDCLDSTFNDTVINSLLSFGGAGTVVNLCAKAIIPLRSHIEFTAPFQGITTKGSSSVGSLTSDRATLQIQGTAGMAILGNCNTCSYLSLTNIIVDGNRPNLGYNASANALIEIGGTNSNGQFVSGISAFEPRGWSALHVIEGTGLTCTNATITNNQLGPAGQAPTPNQRRRMKRDATKYPAGQWADGLSLSCRKSTVTGNTITDATDGGIVIFGSPGSTIQGNTIVTNERQALGGINAVDFAPFSGDFTNTVVTGNTLSATGAQMKLGIAVGYMSWTSPNNTAMFTKGGSFSGNTFTTSGKGYFSYGITASGVNSATITGNVFTSASFGGYSGGGCIAPLPAFGPLLKNPYTAKKMTTQSSFVDGVFSYAICAEPGSITSSGVTVLGN